MCQSSEKRPTGCRLLSSLKVTLTLISDRDSSEGASFQTDASKVFGQAPASPKEADLLGLHSEVSHPKVGDDRGATRESPSNFDILSGIEPPTSSGPSAQNLPEQDLLGGMTAPNTAFDPFQSHPTRGGSEALKPEAPSSQNDVFSSFASFDPFATGQADTTPATHPTPVGNDPDNFDPFKPASNSSVRANTSGSNLLGGWMNSGSNQSLPKQTPTPKSNPSKTSLDPFADIASFGKSSGSSKTTTLNSTPTSKLSGQSTGAAPVRSNVSVNASPTSQPRQSKPNYNVNIGSGQQNWKASKLDQVFPFYVLFYFYS